MESTNKPYNDRLIIIFLLTFMAYHWMNTELWSRSFWINETDTLSFAKYGIEGFGFGYSPLIYIYHLILEIFGPNDLIFRISSLLFSLVTLIAIYRISKYVDETNYTSLFACVVFILSSYSIDHGLQIRSYAINTMLVTLIFFWCIRIFKEGHEINRKEKIIILLISISIWPPTSHYFAMFYLFVLFSFLILIFDKGMEFNRSLVSNPLFPPITTLILFSGIRSIDILSSLINSSKGEHFSGGGSSEFVTTNITDYLDGISGQSIIVTIMIIFGILSAAHHSKQYKDKYNSKLLILILINILLPAIVCLALQYKLSGIHALRYLYIWYPLICVISGFGFSYFIRNLSKIISKQKKEKIEIILSIVFLVFVLLTVKSEPIVNYGAMSEVVEFVNENVEDEENLVIISSPPEHILEYYLIQHDVTASIFIGSWSLEEISLNELDVINGEVIVIFGIQPQFHWIFDFMETWLFENNYSCNPEESFSSKGDEVRICRR